MNFHPIYVCLVCCMLSCIIKDLLRIWGMVMAGMPLPKPRQDPGKSSSGTSPGLSLDPDPNSATVRILAQGRVAHTALYFSYFFSVARTASYLFILCSCYFHFILIFFHIMFMLFHIFLYFLSHFLVGPGAGKMRRGRRHIIF